jgi:hypothetical protein
MSSLVDAFAGAAAKVVAHATISRPATTTQAPPMLY